MKKLSRKDAEKIVSNLSKEEIAARKAKSTKATKAVKALLPAPSADAPKITKAPAAKPSPKAAPKPKKVAPKKEVVLLPEAERRELRVNGLIEYNLFRKAMKLGTVTENMIAKNKEFSRLYREQNLREFSTKK